MANARHDDDDDGNDKCNGITHSSPSILFTVFNSLCHCSNLFGLLIRFLSLMLTITPRCMHYVPQLAKMLLSDTHSTCDCQSVYLCLIRNVEHSYTRHLNHWPRLFTWMHSMRIAFHGLTLTEICVCKYKCHVYVSLFVFAINFHVIFVVPRFCSKHFHPDWCVDPCERVCKVGFDISVVP